MFRRKKRGWLAPDAVSGGAPPTGALCEYFEGGNPMKKFLSLVLALVMTMSLVTVSAGAKEFKDETDVTYDEAVAVISEIGVVDGDTSGNFRPTDNLSRGAAAKIICNLILGPTTAAELKADTAPYKDVPVSNTFSGYIAYCAKEGIISGYADGSFRPAGTLTGYAFMKMLLGALGYDSNYEGYTGGNWSINVAKQAIGIGLNKGMVEEFNGVDFVTREEAALYAFNTLKATMVDYDQKITTNVNGVDVTISQGNAKPVTWTEGINEDGNIKDDGFVQFAEEFFPKLVRKDDSTKFEEPANTWVYDKTEIGTFERIDLIVETYTTGVSGKDAYDLLKPGVISDNKLEVYVDGVDMKGTGTGKFDKDDLVRSKTADLGSTGNGVVTKVYLDTDNDVITFVSINTWLAKATADYSESKEYAPLSVYTGVKTTKSYNVDKVDVSNVVDVKKDTYYQVNISYKDNSNGEIAVVAPVEILEDSTVTKFSAGNNGNGTGKVTKLTTGGEEYKANVKAFYDNEILDTYNETLLTDATYNVYVDANGYFIGVDLFEGAKNYVFITGFDRNSSNLSVKTATASAIFLDGTMKNIEVNVTDTDKNIDKATGHNASHFQKWSDTSWQTGRGTNGVYNLNQWYTYTVAENGEYTLKPATRMTVTGYALNDANATIRTDNLSLVDQLTANNRVYGEDSTVFLTVDLDVVDTTNGVQKAITEVTGVYTGVQNVDIDIDVTDPQAVQQKQVFTVYDSDWYVIGAVVIGEARGSTANYAYIISGAKSEEKKDNTYYWEFDAVMGGEKVTLTAKSKYSNTILSLTKGKVQELRFDGDYVVSIKDLDNTDVYSDFTNTINKHDVYFIDADGKDYAGGNLGNAANDVATELTLQGRTLYVTANRSDVGLGLKSGAKAVTIQKENGEADVVTNFSDVSSALGHLADANENAAGLQYSGKIVAVLDSNGVAEWIVFINNIELKAGNQGGQGGSTSMEDTVNGFNVNIALVDTPAAFNTIATRAALAVTKAGYKNAMPAFLTGGTTNGVDQAMGGFLTAYDQNNNMVYFTVTYTNYWTIKVDGRVVDTVKHNADSTVLTGSQAVLTGAGTGYVMGSTFKAYDAPDLNSVTNAVVITTGYAKLPASLPITVSNDSLTFKGYETVGGNNVFKVANGLTAELTTGSGNSVTGEQAITLSLTGGTGAVISNATQKMSESNYEASGNKLTWSINTSNMTSDITNATVAVANAPAMRTWDYSNDIINASGLTVKLSGVKSAMDGETVTVTLTLSGTPTASDDVVTLSNVTGSWVNSSLSNNMTPSGLTLTLVQGVEYNTTVEFKFVVSSTIDGQTVTAAVG